MPVLSRTACRGLRGGSARSGSWVWVIVAGGVAVAVAVVVAVGSEGFRDAVGDAGVAAGAACGAVEVVDSEEERVAS